MLARLWRWQQWKPKLRCCEELRVICGTRGVPGTVAPFRAWRGSRDLVAQSPKLHAPAVVHHDCRIQFNTRVGQLREREKAKKLRTTSSSWRRRAELHRPD